MASQVGGDLSRIESGPCKVTFKGVDVGHTVGGVTFTAKPLLRQRKVDEYGEHVADLIHQGEDVTVKATFAEKTMSVLQTVFQMSYSEISSTSLGIGKLPGGKASDSSGKLTLHPLDGDGVTDDVVFHQAVVEDVDEVQFGVFTADRVFGCTFRCLIDESKSDGQLIGTIGVAAT